MLTFVDLFAGIGGFSLGLERAGLRCVGHVEIDPHCQKVLRRHWPDVRLMGDIRDVNGADVQAGVVTFGSPCQDLSVAGKRAGMVGERSGLFFEATRIIREMQEATDGRYPRIAVWENVCGAFSSRGGRDFAAVLSAFRDLRAMDIGWSVLDSQWHGVAQRRRRVFVVADFGGQCADEILSLADRVQGYPAPSREAGEEVAPTISARPTGGGGLGTDFDCDGGVVSVTLTRQGAGSLDPEMEPIIPILEVGKRCGTQNSARDGIGIGNPGDPMFTLQSGAQHAVAFGFDPGQSNNPKTTMQITEDGAPPLPAGAGAAGRIAVAFAQNQRDELRTMDVAGAVAAEPGMHQQTLVAYRTSGNCGVMEQGEKTAALNCASDPTQQIVRGPVGVRRLTPRESERLQGFPDDFTRWADDGKEIADSPRYKMLGNAVTVSVAEWIGRRVMQAVGNQP